MADALDHQEIPEEVYNILKNFDDTAKIIKIGGKVLLVAGAIADTIALGDAIHTDLNDADQKLGKLTAQTGASIIGSWSGGALGAKAGAYTRPSCGHGRAWARQKSQCPVPPDRDGSHGHPPAARSRR